MSILCCVGPLIWNSFFLFCLLWISRFLKGLRHLSWIIYYFARLCEEGGIIHSSRPYSASDKNCWRRQYCCRIFVVTSYFESVSFQHSVLDIYGILLKELQIWQKFNSNFDQIVFYILLLIHTIYLHFIMNILEHLQELTFLDDLRRLLWKDFFFWTAGLWKPFPTRFLLSYNRNNLNTS